MSVNYDDYRKKLNVFLHIKTFLRRDDARMSTRSRVLLLTERLISTWQVPKGRLAMAAIS